MISNFFLTGVDPADFAKQFNNAVNNNEGVDSINKLGGEVAGAGRSGFRLALTIGFIVVTISLIIAGIKLATGSSRTRSDAKQKILAAVVAGALLCSVITIILIIEGIANGFVEQ